MRKFFTRKCDKGLVGKNWNQKIVFLVIFTRMKISDSIHPEQAGIAISAFPISRQTPNPQTP
ncbi:hypothetical protein CQ13_21995 [Bradyrhizobium retamae]|uniref:Uncharacterized protein n=1 Tax=Bradyrhizobium retamae TaxID=1300035 RepID=A0A0R3N506_9BRAD|nr:hypothetical protein CQ13_21995 [Bradyrhizobium retamae]